MRDRIPNLKKEDKKKKLYKKKDKYGNTALAERQRFTFRQLHSIFITGHVPSKQWGTQSRSTQLPIAKRCPPGPRRPKGTQTVPPEALPNHGRQRYTLREAVKRTSFTSRTQRSVHLSPDADGA